MKRNLVLTLLLALALVGATTASTSAAVARISTTKNCDTHVASAQVRASYTVDPKAHGAGPYYITTNLLWERPTSTGFARAESHVVTSPHTSVSATKTLSITNSDTHTWSAGGYYQGWRAHVISRLWKDRTGTADLNITTEQKYYARSVFLEKATDCVSWGS